MLGLNPLRVKVRGNRFDAFARNRQKKPTARYEPLSTRMAHDDVFYRTQNRTAIAIAYPTELGQENKVVVLLQLDLLGIGESDRIVYAIFTGGG